MVIESHSTDRSDPKTPEISSETTKASWLQFSIRGLLIMTVIGALVAYQFRPKEVAGELTFVSADRAKKTAVFRLTNTAPNAIWFTGYSVDSPLYTSETRNASGWNSAIGGWCGTGADLRCLRKGDSTDFTVLLMDDTADAVQVSLYCSDGRKDGKGKTISSERFEIATGKVLPRVSEM